MQLPPPGAKIDLPTVVLPSRQKSPKLFSSASSLKEKQPDEMPCRGFPVRIILLLAVAVLFALNQLEYLQTISGFGVATKVTTTIPTDDTDESDLDLQDSFGGAEFMPPVLLSEEPSIGSSINKHESKSAASLRTKEDSPTTANDEKKPWLILHIGPPKTGTTSIQCGLQQYSKQLVELANYYYIGIKCAAGRSTTRENIMPNNESGISGLNLALNMNGILANDATNEIFQRLDEHQRQGHNVIISSEHLFYATRTNKENINELWEAFKSKISGFRVKAVMVHRFLVDWVPSQYYQTFASESKNLIPSFSTYLDDSLTYWETNKGRKPNMKSIDFLPVQQLWSQHFDLDIMDFYSEDYSGDVSYHFLCDYIPDANKLCQYVSRDKAQNPPPRQGRLAGDVIHARVSGSVQPLRAFFHARHLYNISSIEDTKHNHKTKRNFLVNGVGVFAKYGIESDPSYRDCINPAQEARLRNYSATVMQVYHERQNGRPMTEQELAVGMGRQDALFEKDKMKWKYCDVSMERLFSNETILKELMDFDKV